MPRSQADGAPAGGVADPRVAAVVVAYRSAETLRACLTPLLQDPVVDEVVVVDNSAQAAAAALVAQLAGSQPVGRLRYLAPEHNVGFAAACNLGARSSSAPVLALVNPDVHLSRSLDQLARRAAAGRDVVTGALLGATGLASNARDHASPRVEVRRALLGTPAVRPVPLDDGWHPVDQVDGALLVLARSTYEQVGRLDERFPLYYEDVALCWQARRAGGAVLVHGAAYGTHVGGVSSRQNSASYQTLRVSRLRWLRSTHGRAGAALGLLLTVLECVTRAAGRTDEGVRTRVTAVRTCARELRRPLSQQPLQSGQGR